MVSFSVLKRASVMDNLLWLNSVNNIFVLLTRSSLVRGMLWLASACCFRAPDARCIVRRRERVVCSGHSDVGTITVSTVTV